MKNRFIASLVGGIIIFVWQFVSWTVSGIHDGAAKYHPQQDAIMNMLSSNITEDGMYLMPTPPPGTNMEGQQKYMDSLMENNSSMASVMFIKKYEHNMVRSMIRGFLVDVFLVFLLIFILSRAGNPLFGRWISGAIAVGFFTWLWGPYTAHNWFLMPWSAIWGHLVDAIAAWAICGIWLGWYMNRNRARV